MLTISTFSLGIDTTEEQVLEEIVKHVRQSIGPVAAFRNAVFVKQLPKTRSGKIPRSALSALVNGKPYKVSFQGCSVLGSDMVFRISLASARILKVVHKHELYPYNTLFKVVSEKSHSHSFCSNKGLGKRIN